MISPEFYTVQDEVQGLALHPKWCRALLFFNKEVRIEYELSDYI
jgi:hypothetical protein